MNSDGALSFGTTSIGRFGLTWGLPNSDTESYIAPLWTSENGGEFCYWTTVDNSSINNFEDFLENEEGYTRFNPSLVLVASWKNVLPFALQNSEVGSTLACLRIVL